MERYKEPLQTKEQYFSCWVKEELEHLSNEHKDAIYQEYRTRHIVFNRDNFKCQVKDCPFKDSPITLHHYKQKHKGGKTTPRNCVSMCRAHQNHYHSGKAAVQYAEMDYLPNHIKGRVQALHTYVCRCLNDEPKSVPKNRLYEMRLVRKQHKELWGKPLTWEQILILMTFLFSSG